MLLAHVVAFCGENQTLFTEHPTFLCRDCLSCYASQQIQFLLSW